MNRWTSTSFRDQPVPVNQDLKNVLSLWLREDFLLSRVLMHIPAPTLEIMVDASLHGWCGILLPKQVQGEWPPVLFPESMNWKELQAILLSGSFPSSPRRKVSQDLVGQLDSPFMHSPSRIPSLPEALAPHQGTLGSLFASSDHPSSLSLARSPQCSS